ncbi:MAG TPA: hypothetical protein VGM37_21605 [Armatimonadota bacterium]|jgi:hypothetical protein
MGASAETQERGWRNSAATIVRNAIESGGQDYWRRSDFPQLPPGAVSQALSRLAREAFIERASKGIYYHARPTAFGKSRPSPTAIQSLSGAGKKVFPAGVHAANLLGFTTQTAPHGEYATTAGSLPKTLTGKRARVYTRRPPGWNELSEAEAATLDFLRRRARTSELPPHETIERLLTLLGDQAMYERLARAALCEPPRVRVMLGAIGQELHVNPKTLQQLRDSLNPVSRFDFGALAGLRHAREWQAKA